MRIWFYLGIFVFLICIYIFFYDSENKYNIEVSPSEWEGVKYTGPSYGNNNYSDLFRYFTTQNLTPSNITLNSTKSFTPKTPFLDPITKQSNGYYKRSHKNEEEVREILERLLNKKFKSVRPEWLKRPDTKQKLEIDCFNPELKLAVEVNGKQHYKYNRGFHRSRLDFEKQKERDTWKKQECEKHGITLIEVPYNKWKKKEKYLIKELSRLGFL